MKDKHSDLMWLYLETLQSGPLTAVQAAKAMHVEAKTAESIVKCGLRQFLIRTAGRTMGHQKGRPMLYSLTITGRKALSSRKTA